MTDDNDDLLAGEYVLGTLDAETRATIALRRTQDRTLDEAIRLWEARLSPMSESSAEAEPRSELWSGILARIAALETRPGPPAPDGTTILMLKRRVQRWKRAATAATAIAACLAAWVAVVSVRDLARPAPMTFVAFLQKEDTAPAYVMKADLGHHSLAVRPVTATPPSGKSYELWVIDPQIGPPKSLGVLDPATSTHELPTGIAADVLARATYAVTIEQAGGSPTGSPSGAPVFFGHLISAAL